MPLEGPFGLVIIISLASLGFQLNYAKMYLPNPPSSHEKQMESREYMDIEGFEGFFQETNERRVVEFAEFIHDSDDFDKLDGKIPDSVAKDNDDSAVIEESDGDELLLLQEILNFKDEVEVRAKIMLRGFHASTIDCIFHFAISGHLIFDF